MWKKGKEQDGLEWIQYNRTEDGPITDWLDKHRPSVLKDSDGVAWISARKQEINDGNSKYEDDGEGESQETLSVEAMKMDQLSRMTNEWERLGLDATLDDALYLASKYSITAGKWKIFARPNRVDRIWKNIIIAMFQNKLKYVISAKVSPLNAFSNGSHLICVYNKNFFNKEEVFEAETSLRKVYFGRKLVYKPDIFTYLGIYRQNKWNINPTLFVSKGPGPKYFNVRQMHEDNVLQCRRNKS